MSTTGVAEIVKWSVVTVAGLGAYDTVAGATTMSQVAPTPVVTPIKATAGTAMSLTVQVTGAPGNPGSWQVIGTLPTGITKSSSGSTCTISGIPTNAGSFPFTLKAWENSGNSGGSISKALTISVSAVAPVITSNPLSTITINSGGTTSLTVAASGTTPTYQWYLGSSGDISNPVSGATSPTFTTPVLTADTAYWARATNAVGSANSTTSTITVRIPPAITAQPASTTVSSGGIAILTVAASGTSPSFQWYIGNAGDLTNPIAAATSTSYTTPALGATTHYWVRASNAAGTANSNMATVTIEAPPAITTPPASATVTSGGTANLTVVASGTSPTFQWYLGNSGDTSSPISGAINSSYLTPPITVATSFWVRATNLAGHADSTAAIISLLDSYSAWQNSQFTTAQLADSLISGSSADPDGDGFTNSQEFVFGMPPLVSGQPPSPAFANNSGQLTLAFTAKAATGPGYEGMTRHYALECSDLSGAAWTPVAGFSDIVGNGQVVSYPIVAAGPCAFYHLKVWLTP